MSSVEPPSKNAGRSQVIFLALCAIGLFAILSSTMSKNPVLKLFASSLGTPDSWTGFVAAASTIPGILVSLPAGSLSDVFGRRKMLLASSIVFASAPFFYLLITSWWQLVLVRFYHGFATAIFVPIANATIVELFPSRKGERISSFSSATMVGRGIAPFLGGYILSVTNSNFHDLYLTVGIAGLTAFIVGIPLLTKRDAARESIEKRSTALAIIRGWGSLARNRNIQMVGFVEAVQYYTYGAVEYFLVGYLKDVIGLNSLLIGILSGSYIVVLMATKPLMGALSDRVGRRTPIALGAVIMGVPLAAIPLSANFIAILVLTAIYGFGFAIVTSSTPALASELVPKTLLGTSMGFLSTIMDVGQTLGPVVCGFILAANLGYAGVFLSLTILLIGSSILFLISGIGKSVSTKAI